MSTSLRQRTAPVNLRALRVRRCAMSSQHAQRARGANLHGVNCSRSQHGARRDEHLRLRARPAAQAEALGEAAIAHLQGPLAQRRSMSAHFERILHELGPALDGHESPYIPQQKHDVRQVPGLWSATCSTLRMQPTAAITDISDRTRSRTASLRAAVRERKHHLRGACHRGRPRSTFVVTRPPLTDSTGDPRGRSNSASRATRIDASRRPPEARRRG